MSKELTLIIKVRRLPNSIAMSAEMQGKKVEILGSDMKSALLACMDVLLWEIAEEREVSE